MKERKNVALIFIVFSVVLVSYFGFKYFNYDDQGTRVVKKNVNIKDYQFFGQDLFSFEGLDYNEFTYINVTDYVELLNYINEFMMMYESFEESNFDYSNEQIRAKYAEEVIMRHEQYTIAGFSNFNYQGDKYVGSKELVINSVSLPWVKYRNEVYVPLELLRYKIFDRHFVLIKTNDTDYYWLGRTASGTMFYSDDNHRFKDIEFRNVSFQKSLDMMSQYDDVSFSKLDGNTYDEYILKLAEGYHKTRDSHFVINPISDVTNDTRRSYLDLWMKFHGEDALSAEGLEQHHKPYYEKLNSNTYYIDIHSFSREVSFVNEVSNFIQEVDGQNGVENIIVDFRFNSGGSYSNSVYLLNKLINKDFTFNYKYRCDDTLCMKSLDFDILNERDKDYNYTVILNEYSASAALLTAFYLKDIENALVIGEEPRNKKTEMVVCYQYIDNTLGTRTDPFYNIADKDGITANEMNLVSLELTQTEVEVYLENIRKKEN